MYHTNKDFKEGQLCCPSFDFYKEVAVPLLCKDSLRSAPRLSNLSGQFDFAPLRRYDSRALTGAPIVPLPRNWLASSATGGASPISSSRKVLFLTRTPQGGFSCCVAAIHL
ncbi:MAG: hypothetical protein ACLRSD_14965 [Oscillibacter sp.]